MAATTGSCACCVGVELRAPALVQNRAGLSAIAYRVGVYADFKRSMLAALSSFERPALAPLTSRENDDFSIALLDAWAVVSDVLTFYQERIANECHLRTATELLSVQELARLIGYELRPGVAASTYLAFTLDPLPGSPPEATVAAGTKVQSVPGPNELPQTFESVQAIEARARWSALGVRQGKAHEAVAGDESIFLAGTATGLKPGDALLFLGTDREKSTSVEEWDFRRVISVEADAKANRTEVTWNKPLLSDPPVLAPKGPMKVYALRLRANLFGHSAPDWRAMSPQTQASYHGSATGLPNEWPKFALSAIAEASDEVQLDAHYSSIVMGSWVVLSHHGARELYLVTLAQEDARANFAIASKTTRLGLAGENLNWFEHHVRSTVVFAQSERLEVAETPIRAPLDPDAFFLAGRFADFEVGRRIIVRGKRIRVTVTQGPSAISAKFVPDDGLPRTLLAGEVYTLWSPRQLKPNGTVVYRLLDARGAKGTVTLAQPGSERLLRWTPAAETDEWVADVTLVQSVDDGDVAHTRLVLETPLAHSYDRLTVTVYGNVASATHGETVQEVLGSGDASRPYQRFQLKQKPLTHVSAPTPSGAESTLAVYADDLKWHELPALHGADAREHAYTVRRDPAQTSTLEFGDGHFGARPPSGQNNLRAIYRKGLGRAGNVKAGQLSQLMTRPLGLTSATNPLAAQGGADPESVTEARANAPLTVLALERVVSLLDYENFARAFSSIDKALATWTWDGRARRVFLSVAGPNGAEISADNPTLENLVKALARAGDPNVPLRVESYRPRFFELGVRVKVASDRIPAEVLADVERTLRVNLGFAARALGESVAASRIILALQSRPGVVAVELTHLFLEGDSPSSAERLLAEAPRIGQDDASVLAAELLMLSQGPLYALGEMA